MQTVSRKALWYLVITTMLAMTPVAGSAEEAQYQVSISADSDAVDVRFLSCNADVVPLVVTSDSGQFEFKSADDVGPCRAFLSSVPYDASLGAILVAQGGEVNIVEMPKQQTSSLSLSSEVKSVLIFVGGLVAAMAGRVLALVLDPIYYSVKLSMKYRASKRFFSSVSDSFEKDFAISDDLLGVARGEFLTNFLLTTSLRRKIQNLIYYIEEWKQNELSPKEFRDRLDRL